MESLIIKTTKRKLGVNWVNRYHKRNQEVLSKMACALDRQRSTANNPETIEAFCMTVEKTVHKYNNLLQNIWNMDEKGFILVEAAKCKVICRAGRRNP